MRLAGGRWRLLVHDWVGRRDGGPLYGTATHITSATGGPPDTDLRRTISVPGTELDEVVVGRWLHLEQMDTGLWWLNVGGVVLTIRVDRDGRPRRVRVAGPGDDDDPAKGCTYELTWTLGGGADE